MCFFKLLGWWCFVVVIGTIILVFILSLVVTYGVGYFVYIIVNGNYLGKLEG